MCLNLVLQTLLDNGGLLCFYECEEFDGFPNLILVASPAYQKLFTDLGLSNDESIQLLEVLKSKGYIDYAIGGIGNTVFFKVKVNKESGEINYPGTIKYEDYMKVSVLKPTKIKLLLAGKFFIIEGGYTSQLSKTESSVNKGEMTIAAIGLKYQYLRLAGLHEGMNLDNMKDIAVKHNWKAKSSGKQIHDDYKKFQTKEDRIVPNISDKEDMRAFNKSKKNRIKLFQEVIADLEKTPQYAPALELAKNELKNIDK